jgi:arylsulfatase A-like enzyme
MFAVTWFPAPHRPHEEQPVELPGDIVPYEGDDAGYFREIQLIDQQLGRLRATLRELGIAENTIVWYCSDNGGLLEGSSGGREKKGSIYEGGLRVPAMLEWPAKYRAGEVDVPAFTSDIYPSLLAVAGVSIEHQPRLDGVDLAEVVAGRQTERPAIGFWDIFAEGQNTDSDGLIRTLLQAQQAGEPNPLPGRLLKNVNEFPDLPDGQFNGHAAWNQWPWKLHRIERGDHVRLELYHLVDDPMETTDLSEIEADRAEAMLAELEAWQASVFDSLEGKDYVNKQ